MEKFINTRNKILGAILLILIFIAVMVSIAREAKSQEYITDADISNLSWTVLTDLEDGLINSMNVTYHYEWLGNQSATSSKVRMSASVK